MWIGTCAGLFYGLLVALSMNVALATEKEQESGATTGSHLRLYGVGSGRFEISAAAGEDGLSLARIAESGWRVWREPFALPEKFRSGITVRLIAAEQWRFTDPSWRVVGEPGAVVSVWIRGGGVRGVERERRWLAALAEGVLYRQAMYLNVKPENITIPAWLLLAAGEAVVTSGSGASLLDAWQQDVRQAGAMPTLVQVLYRKDVQKIAVSDESWRRAAFGLWQWLRSDGNNTLLWRQFLAAVLAGRPPQLALQNVYKKNLAEVRSEADLELVWQATVAALARTLRLPQLSASDSRLWLASLDRFVVANRTSKIESVVKLSKLWRLRNELVVQRALEGRGAELELHYSRVHPFYINAASALGRSWLALRGGTESEWALSTSALRIDFEEGEMLEAASAKLLDTAKKE
jgi:hypothetical protein